MFRVQHLHKLDHFFVLPLHRGTFVTHSYKLIFTNDVDPTHLVITAWLDSVNSITSFKRWIQYKLIYQWSDWVPWLPNHLSYISKVFIVILSVHLYYQFMKNRAIKSCRINWVRCGVLGLWLPRTPTKMLHTSVSVLRVSKRSGLRAKRRNFSKNNSSGEM